MTEGTETPKPKYKLRELARFNVVKDDATGEMLILIHFETSNIDERVEATSRTEERLHQVMAILRPFVRSLQETAVPAVGGEKGN